MADLIELLKRAAEGDRDAYEQAYTLAYPVLKQLARRQKRAQPGPLEASTTSVVNDACLRLMRGLAVEGEAHFYAIAARAMRQILIDRARERQAAKRGGGAVAVDWDEVADLAMPGLPPCDMLALDQALGQLAVIDPRLVRVVELHCFAGLELDDVGRLTETSGRTARRDWHRARAFLALNLEGHPA